MHEPQTVSLGQHASTLGICNIQSGISMPYLLQHSLVSLSKPLLLNWPQMNFQDKYYRNEPALWPPGRASKLLLTEQSLSQSHLCISDHKIKAPDMLYRLFAGRKCHQEAATMVALWTVSLDVSNHGCRQRGVFRRLCRNPFIPEQFRASLIIIWTSLSSYSCDS